MALFCAITLLCAISIPAHAGTITVTNTNDSGPGSLRQALIDAQDGDTIAFDLSLPAIISLTSGELVINKNISLIGPGANLLTIARAQGAPTFRIFHVSASHTVTIQSVTISNGSGLGFNRGAGIWNDHSNLTVNNCVVTGNALDRQVDGGGIDNDAGDSGSASLTINNSTIAANNLGAGGSVSFGGGIYNFGLGGNAILTINNSTISGNRSFQGGGLFSDGGVPGSIAIVTVNNSTFSGNYADQYAGGIMNEGNEGGQATVIVTNSTFAGNSSCNCNFFAGAIFNDGNTQPGGAMLEMSNTIFKGGLENPRNIDNQGGVVVSGGYNLTNDAGVLNTNGGSGGFNGPGEQLNTEPMLGPLQDNGGLTPTHALLPGSPAIDAGDPTFTPPPFFDQRGPGFNRVVDGRIDKGSFEVQFSSTPTPTPSATATTTPTPIPTATATTTATATATPTATGTATPTATATATPTATPSATPRPTPTPRVHLTPRPRPTPPPRP
jgi:Predicted solute binding protein